MTKKPRDQVYAEPRSRPGRFQFDDTVARVFADMVSRSVPGYELTLTMIGVLAAHYAREHTVCYDLGCSLGASTLAMRHHIPEHCRIIAVDNSPSMTQRCAANIRDDIATPIVDIICADLQTLQFTNASLVTLNFTLQFVPAAQRLDLLQRLQRSLIGWRRAHPIGKKLPYRAMESKPCFEQLHHDFKHAMGYSRLEIAQKRAALEQVLIPDTVATHKERLHRAGFSEVYTWFQCFNFCLLAGGKMIRFDDAYAALARTPLAPRVAEFRAAIGTRYEQRLQGDHRRWQQAFDQLPDITTSAYELTTNTVTAYCEQPLSFAQTQQLKEALDGLHPWRKGPFRLFDLTIDTEWRSDWKWQRLQSHISDLAERTVLDVGCGSGYHCWRMYGAGAKLVIGIDPSQKFLFQFHAIKKYLGPQAVYYLPLRSEDLPVGCQAFDTVFSMGVLYHRRSPFDHLEELKRALKPGGELVLETLVIEGGRNQVLVPGERYAQMRNVWYLPSTDELLHWLGRAGFEQERLVDVNQTTTQEQRSTEWMRFHSLVNFLDPDDPDKTIEGYPAPRRATLIARRSR